MKINSVILAILYSVINFLIPIALIVLSLKFGLDWLWLILLTLFGSVLVWFTYVIVQKKREMFCVKLMVTLVIFASPILSFILTFCFSHSILVLFKVDEIFSIAEIMLVFCLDVLIWMQVIISQILLLFFHKNHKSEM